MVFDLDKAELQKGNGVYICGVVQRKSIPMGRD